MPRRRARTAEGELAPAQQHVLEMVENYYRKYGRSPAYREIVACVPAVTSLSQVGGHLRRLRDLGYLTYESGIARGCVPARRDAAIRRGIPVKGAIAAGSPLEIWDEGEWDVLSIAIGALPPPAGSDIYALRVRGDSMIGDGILDGDWLIVREASAAPNGAIVVAVDRTAGLRGAATVKRVYKSDTHVRLQPANPKHTARMIRADEWDRNWTIQGIVVATYRQF